MADFVAHGPMDRLLTIPLDHSADPRVGDQPFNSSAAQNASVSGGTSLSVHTTMAFEPRLKDGMTQKSRFRIGKQRAGALAGFASVMAILFTVLLCRSSHYRKTEPLSVGRKLSSDGDSSDEDFVTFCHHEAYAESEQIASKELERQSLSEEAGLIPPPAKVARLERGVFGEGSLSRAGDGNVPMSRASVVHYAPPISQPGSTSFEYGSVSGRNEAELEAASALLNLQHLPEAQTHPVTSSQPITEKLLSTAGPLSSKPTATEPLTPSRTSAPTSQILEEEEASSTTSSASDLSDSNAAFASHPFYRLPKVNPVDLRTPRFSHHIALSLNMANRPVSTLLMHMRELLVKDKLEKEDLNELAHLTHGLVGFVYRSEGVSVAMKPKKFAVFVLGRRFLALDAVLSALQMLGLAASSCGWWTEFTSAINHEHSFGVKFKGRSQIALWNDALLRKLVRGILHLKTGSRLSPAETVSIKRMLFCSPLSPPIFRSSSWDMWRVDDEPFQSLESSEDPSASPRR